MDNKTILNESEIISQNTRNIIEAAERNALRSLSIKEQNIDTRRNELNLLGELRKYRRSEEAQNTAPAPLYPKRKAKSI